VIAAWFCPRMADPVTEYAQKSTSVRHPTTDRGASTRGSVAVAWALLLVVALATRPLLPIDETRYASVAWEMWRTGNYLVPHLNGHPYSDKPPLLFWLICGGWSLLGPGEYWARLVGPLSAVAALVLTSVLGRRLWRDPLSSRLAPVVLAGTLIWAVYGTLLLFDMVLSACVLIGLIGLVDARRGHRRGFILVAIGVGAGLLAKGPVVLIHLMPAAILAGWWDVRQPASIDAPAAVGPTGRTWVAGIAAATLAGAAIALAWAVPAAMAGGPVYARAIFVGQTAGRVVRSFAHRRPLWWYVPNLLWMLLPWLAWPPLWRAARSRWRTRVAGQRFSDDAGLRFCAAVAIPGFIIFSIVSGKQVHYLLPEVPLFALAVSRVLVDGGDRVTRVLGPNAWVPRIAVITLLIVVIAHIAAAPYLRRRYDGTAVARHLATLEQRGFPLANEGPYAGQFSYVGRLRRPVEEVPVGNVAAWLATHPDGRVITYPRSPDAAGPGVAERVQRYEAGYVVVRRAK
jgi:4-amino-4-deoxy-L-arabinose transferase-like glycosyltransferase